MYEITGKLLILKYPLRLSHTLLKGVYYIMKEINLSQGKFCKNRGKYVALVDDEDYELLNQFRWCANKIGNTFYAIRNIVIDGKHKVQYMHGDIMNGKGIDHIDHNGLNNQKSNLRFCTKRENSMNQRKMENASSIYKGVTFNKRDRNWIAQIMINGKNIRLGCFISETEAAKAYNTKAIALFCEFANLNVVDN